MLCTVILFTQLLTVASTSCSSGTCTATGEDAASLLQALITPSVTQETDQAGRRMWYGKAMTYSELRDSLIRGGAESDGLLKTVWAGKTSDLEPAADPYRNLTQPMLALGEIDNAFETEDKDVDFAYSVPYVNPDILFGPDRIPWRWTRPRYHWSLRASSTWSSDYTVDRLKQLYTHHCASHPWHAGQRTDQQPQWIEFRLPAVVKLYGIRIWIPSRSPYDSAGFRRCAYEWPESHFRRGKWEYSNDGVTWITSRNLYGHNSIIKKDAWNYYMIPGNSKPFKPVTAKYWRLYMDSDNGYGYLTIPKIEFALQDFQDPPYIELSSGRKFCPMGYVTVTSDADCARAAQSLPQKTFHAWDLELASGWDGIRLHGCFSLSPDFNILLNNPYTVNEENSYDGDKRVCKKLPR